MLLTESRVEGPTLSEDLSRLRIGVIGAGPGGYPAAFHAADYGMQVTLIDPQIDPGGVCLFVGCIPSKALLHVARLLDEAREAADWGIYVRAAADRPRQAARLEAAVVRKMTGGLGVARQGRASSSSSRASRRSSTRTRSRIARAGGAEETAHVRLHHRRDRLASDRRAGLPCPTASA